MAKGDFNLSTRNLFQSRNFDLLNNWFSNELSAYTPVMREVSYPKYNILYSSENTTKIELALAGFKKEDIMISLEKEILTIASATQSANQEQSDAGNTAEVQSEDDVKYPFYFHKGIAKREFTITFKVVKNTIVKSAKLDDGILTVELELPVTENESVKYFKVD